MDEINKFRAEQGLPPYVEKDRKCLSCGTTFKSWGAGNRICSKCSDNHAEDLADTYQFDPEANFQYDLTISQIIEEVTNKGTTWNDYDSRDLYIGGRKEFKDKP